MDHTTRIARSDDRTTRIDAHGAADDATRVITLPPKAHVNLGLAVVAGALAALVLFTAHDRLSAGSARTTSPVPSLAAPTLTAAPSETPAAPPKAKGKHD